jgi:hypothetical protein
LAVLDHAQPNIPSCHPHGADRAAVSVSALRLDRYLMAIDERGEGLFAGHAARLMHFWRVDFRNAYPDRIAGREDFQGIAIDDPGYATSYRLGA